MERDTNQMSQSASLCRSGCGFYGNASNDGLCSQCYKDSVKRKQSAPTQQLTQSSSSSVSHSTAGRNSPISVPIVDSSATLPLLASTFDNSLNTASPTVPSICSSAQDLEGSSNHEISNQSNAVNNTTSEKDCANGSSQTPQPNANSSDPPKTQKKKKNRCSKCKVNIGVIGFPCRCGGTFCSTHRYANEHNCSFDYREHGAEEIRKNNPQVIGEKVTKI